MKLLQTLGKGQGYLKAGLLGFQKSGKTYTACLLAAATRAKFGLKGLIVFVDTENASEYVAPLVKALTGLELIGVRTRKLDDLITAAREATEIEASVLVADSMTHFWRNLCDSYLAGLNETRRRYNKPPRLKMEFQDWGQVKAQWAKWTEVFLNTPLHMIICGRAGYEYDMERSEETGKNELVKTGVKMKTEAEFGFEPSLLVQMESEQEPDEQRLGKFRLIRTATVIGDRFGAIDAKVFNFDAVAKDRQAQLAAVAQAFGPHLDMLKPGAHSTVKTEAEPLEVSEDGDVEWFRERKARTIICEEIQGAITSAVPGQGADDKKRKADLLMQVFGTRSWTAVESMPSEKLRDGLAKLRTALGDPVARQHDDHSTPKPAAPAPAPAPDPKPSTEQSGPPAAPAADVSAELAAKLVAVLPSEALGKVVGWMVSNKWLTSEHGMAENPFLHLDAEKAKKAIANPDKLLRVSGFKSPE